MSDKPFNRRGLLAALIKVYDPLGLEAPFLLKCRQIIQNIYRNNLTWDDTIDDSSSYEWLKWTNHNMTLQYINITRCIKPKKFGEVTHCSLHYFSDACDTGYGILVHAEGVVHFPLLLGKSRVAPLKFIFIPRHELQLYL